ncbi:hypothetical protein [Amycolatopsis sp. NPDC058986]|uniref:hypothetical protein n=1 Tax=unclassified Amycolatopsis TaxID=2618356 RepID=UPI003672540B
MSARIEFPPPTTRRSRVDAVLVYLPNALCTAVAWGITAAGTVVLAGVDAPGSLMAAWVFVGALIGGIWPFVAVVDELQARRMRRAILADRAAQAAAEQARQAANADDITRDDVEVAG